MGSRADLIASLSPEPFVQKRGRPPAESLCSLCHDRRMTWRAEDVLGHNFGSWSVFLGSGDMRVCFSCATNIKNKALSRLPVEVSVKAPETACFLDSQALIKRVCSPLESIVSVPSTGRKLLYPYLLSPTAGLVSDSLEGIIPWRECEALAAKIVCALVSEGLPPSLIGVEVLPELPHARRPRQVLIEMWRWLEPMKTKAMTPLFTKIASHARKAQVVG